MEIVLDARTGEQENWAFVKEGSRIELGAQVVPNDQPTELVVVWRAVVAPDRLRSIVGHTHEALRNHSESFRGRLTGYGPTKEFLNLRLFMANENLPAFEAYRAELETPEDTVVVWANVAHGDNRDLAQATDNIGICVPLRSVTGWGGDLITYAVSSTRDVEVSEVRGWLGAIVAKLLAQSHEQA